MKKMQKAAAIPVTVLMLSAMVVPGMAFAEEAVSAEGVTVEANADSNTGYTVSFSYYNEEATNVQIMGGFQFYAENDENVYAAGYNLEEGDDVNNYFLDPQDWTKDGDLWHVGDAGYIADMENNDGVWTYTLDLPGGSYLYQYNVSYDNGETYEAVVDPENIPYCNELGAVQVRSQFYVPYDAEKQSENEDWTWLMPAENEEDRGTLVRETYTGLDDAERPVEIYLPANYDETREEPYKVLYLSHGGGGDEADWLHQGNAGNVVDRLAADGACEEFLIVTMNNTEFEWDYDKIFENVSEYLIPYVEENYNVSTEAADRAFAGLSMGGMTTTEMYYRDPSLFGYFGIFSGSAEFDFPELDDYSDYAAPTLFIAAGWEDMALINGNYQTEEDNTTVGFAEKLDELGITYNNGEGVYIVQGGHDWFTWPQILKNFVETTLWK